jgi:DNA-binding response OmpR family regulator
MPEGTSNQTRGAVLIVEDDRYVRRALARLLEMEGYAVQASESIGGAMAQLDGQTAVLLDLELPDGLGTTLLHHIRAHHRHVRVAVLSGAPEPLLAEAQQLGPDLLIEKPVDVPQLLAWLRSLPPRPRQSDASGQG